MATQNKLYITASELAELLGISVGHAYRIIKKLNVELEQDGYLVIAGKVPRGYLMQEYQKTKASVEESRKMVLERQINVRNGNERNNDTRHNQKQGD